MCGLQRPSQQDPTINLDVDLKHSSMESQQELRDARHQREDQEKFGAIERAEQAPSEAQ